MTFKIFISCFLCVYLTCAQTDNYYNIIDIELKSTPVNFTKIDSVFKTSEFKLTHFQELKLTQTIDTFIATKKYDSALKLGNNMVSYYVFNNLNVNAAENICIKLHENITNFKNNKAITQYYILYSETLTYQQKFKQSIPILLENIRFLEKTKDTTINEYSYSYLVAAENSVKIENIIDGVNYYKKASDIFKTQKDTISYLWSQNGLSRLLGLYGLYGEAEQAREIIFNSLNSVSEKEVVVMAHITAAIEATTQTSKTDNELYHAKKALDINDQLYSENKDIIKILSYACATYVYARNGLLKESDNNLEKLNNLDFDFKNNAFINTYYSLALSTNLYEHQNYNDAKITILSVIENVKASKETANIIAFEHLLAQTYEKLNETSNAIKHYKNYISIRDSLSQNTTRKRFDYLQNQFNVEKKDLEISENKKNLKLLSTENELKKQWLIFGGLGLIVLFIIIYLWRSKQHLKHKEKLQKQFSKNLISSVEQERKRISSELHDNIGQNLLLIKNKAQLSKNTNTTDIALIKHIIDDVRNISHELHPFRFEKLGLIQSLKHTVDAFQQNSEIFYSENIEAPKQSVSKDKELFVYRMLQECLNNVEKHSKATACKVSIIEQKTYLIFEIKDNGIGFNVSENNSSLKSLGMKTLKERAHLIGAKLTINSVSGNGTTIQIKIFK